MSKSKKNQENQKNENNANINKDNWTDLSKFVEIDETIGSVRHVVSKSYGMWFESWYTDGERNRIDGPAVTYWYENGNKEFESWYTDGKRNRIDGPAETRWYENGNKQSEYWYIDGEQNRIDGPACTYWYENGNKESEYWYIDGERNRIDGPACTYWDENGNKESEYWYIDGKRSWFPIDRSEKFYKILRKDLTSPYQNYQYEIDKEVSCDLLGGHCEKGIWALTVEQVDPCLQELKGDKSDYQVWEFEYTCDDLRNWGDKIQGMSGKIVGRAKNNSWKKK